MTDLNAETAAKIATLQIDSSRPLIVCDADEVLFLFMAGFETYLQARDYVFDWSTYGLVGNIRHRKDLTPVATADARSLLDAFFIEETEGLTPVSGAADALNGLSASAQIIILSNLPFTSATARERALARAGMPYPLVVNRGPKGAAVRLLQSKTTAPVIFIDDILLQHASVRQTAADVTRLHFVADPRLARLLGPSEEVHYRADEWPLARAIIETQLMIKPS